MLRLASANCLTLFIPVQEMKRENPLMEYENPLFEGSPLDNFKKSVEAERVSNLQASAAGAARTTKRSGRSLRDTLGAKSSQRKRAPVSDSFADEPPDKETETTVSPAPEKLSLWRRIVVAAAPKSTAPKPAPVPKSPKQSLWSKLTGNFCSVTSPGQVLDTMAELPHPGYAPLQQEPDSELDAVSEGSIEEMAAENGSEDESTPEQHNQPPIRTRGRAKGSDGSNATHAFLARRRAQLAGNSNRTVSREPSRQIQSQSFRSTPTVSARSERSASTGVLVQLQGSGGGEKMEVAMPLPRRVLPPEGVPVLGRGDGRGMPKGGGRQVLPAATRHRGRLHQKSGHAVERRHNGQHILSSRHALHATPSP